MTNSQLVYERTNVAVCLRNKPVSLLQHSASNHRSLTNAVTSQYTGSNISITFRHIADTCCYHGNYRRGVGIPRAYHFASTALREVVVGFDR